VGELLAAEKPIKAMRAATIGHKNLRRALPADLRAKEFYGKTVFPTSVRYTGPRELFPLEELAVASEMGRGFLRLPMPLE
jgi:hypothetical protein